MIDPTINGKVAVVSYDQSESSLMEDKEIESFVQQQPIIDPSSSHAAHFCEHHI
jgi:hypothetical protein